MVKYKTVKQFSAESGYSEHAIRSKISDGVWPQNKVWRRAPDNRILINVEGYVDWVESAIAPTLIVHRLPKRVVSQRERVSLSPPPLV